MFLVAEAMKAANSVLAPIAAAKKKKRLEESPYAGQDFVRVEVGTIYLPRALYDQFDAQGLWAALKFGKELYEQLRAMRLA